MSFDIPGFTPNFKRQARLAQLSPLDAARALFAYEFGIDDEPGLCFSIHKDERITLYDDALIDLFFDAQDRGLGPEEFLELAASR